MGFQEEMEKRIVAHLEETLDLVNIAKTNRELKVELLKTYNLYIAEIVEHEQHLEVLLHEYEANENEYDQHVKYYANAIDKMCKTLKSNGVQITEAVTVKMLEALSYSNWAYFNNQRKRENDTNEKRESK